MAVHMRNLNENSNLNNNLVLSDPPPFPKPQCVTLKHKTVSNLGKKWKQDWPELFPSYWGKILQKVVF